MPWFNLATNLAGLLSVVAVLFFGIRCLRWHWHGEVPDNGGSYLFAGLLLVSIAMPLALVWGWPSAYGLWINLQAPARVWPTPPIAVAGPEIFLGETTSEDVRAFEGNVEFYSTRVTVLADGGDLVVSAGGFDALKRSRSFDTVTSNEISARVHRREVRRYGGRRGSAYGLVLHKLTESPPQRIGLRLSNIKPYVFIGGANFRFPGALRLCQPECGVDFLLTLGSGEKVPTAPIHVKQR